jgi:aspartyl-tRNA(Asn)/glutamyl-tRNA(Gln) amidotransferase subunit C
MAEIGQEEVARIAELARLRLDEDESARMGRELGAILAYVRQLEAVDVSGVPPTAHGELEGMALRADEPRASLERERVLAAAPEADGGAFAVPAFVDEG